MADTSKNIDRRVQRTQQILKQAFIEVVREKGFDALNIQDITDRANVNRGTFYAHFADKYALGEAVLCEEMKQLVADAFPPVAQWDRSTWQRFIRTVLEYFDGRYDQYRLPSNIIPLFERATHEGLSSFLLEWLKMNKSIRPQLPLETIAHIMSLTILGAAVQRYQMSTPISSDKLAHAVLLVIMEGVEQLA